jgi:hypothetical protein
MRLSYRRRPSYSVRALRRTLAGLESLEERTLLSASLITVAQIPGQNRFILYNYGPLGAVTIPSPPGSTEPQDARGLTVDPSGNIDIYDGTFTPSLATYSPTTQSWSFQTMPGWDTVNSSSYGEVAAYAQYVFASDMLVSGDPNGANGIVRFDTTGGSPLRFGQGTDFIQLTLGLDGMLYGLEGSPNYGVVQVFNPDTLTLVRTVTLQNGPDWDTRGIAVDSSGQFYAASGNGYLEKYDSQGNFLTSQKVNDNLDNVALDTDGTLVAGGRMNGLFQTDESLASVTNYATTYWNEFVTFDHYIGSTANGAPTNLRATPGVEQVALGWNAVSQATSYNVYRSTTSGAETLLQSGVTSTSFTDSGVVGGITYYYEVTAVNGSTEGPRSAEVSALPFQNPSTTDLSTSANPAVYGQLLTFTVTVAASAPGAGTPTGTVYFFDATNSVGYATLSGGTASITTSKLAVGNHTINAVYTGDSNFASSSAAVSETVNKDPTLASVSSSTNPSQFGQSITLTAIVSAQAPGSGTLTGTVYFQDGSTTVGSATLVGGSASYTLATLPAGDNPIVVDYWGDGNFTGAASPIYNQTVNQEASSTTLSSSVNPSVYGQSVTFRAAVTAAGPGGGTPTGTVTFMNGASTLGTGTLLNGVATFTTSGLAVGSQTIAASYGGDGNFAGSSSAAYGQTVNQDGTSTSLASSLNPSVAGQSVTFTATVAALAPGGGAATGTVTFMDGSIALGTGTLSGGSASYTTSSLGVGSHSIAAAYAGDSDFLGSTSATLSQTVSESALVSVDSSVNPSVYGQSVVFTATVSGTAPGGATPTGTVTFMDGNSALTSATLSGGSAAYATTVLAVGSHSIAVVYSGDSTFLGATSAVLNQVVNQDPTVSVVTSSVNPSVYGQSVTFSAVVTAPAPGGGTPTGTVNFVDGTTTLGTATLAGGSAMFTTSSLAAGNHPITAVYRGGGNFAGSTSSTLTQVVNQDSTSAALASSVNPSVYGQPVKFTATVSANSPGSGTPVGTVTFLIGNATLGTSALSGGTASFTISSRAPGTYTITAVYGGSSNFAGSTSQSLAQTVNKDATTTRVSSSANPATQGTMVTFTATVTANAPGSGIPTGTVTFADGSTVLGTASLNSSGVATYATSTLAVGTHPITATYGGDVDFLGSVSAVYNQSITTSGGIGTHPPAVIVGGPVLVPGGSSGASSDPAAFEAIMPAAGAIQSRSLVVTMSDGVSVAAAPLFPPPIAAAADTLPTGFFTLDEEVGWGPA